ncbi:MAG: alanine--tRNA ligase [Parachlamydiaceae bacterium]
MLTQEIRRRFLNYFKEKQHAIISSSAVVPHDDPTLLFTNAGMNQFKDVFLGKSHRDYNRATTSQKCIRVGGKHNDLENVGHTSRHLTFFEMLGNFSFGDYFKPDAIKFSWEVSTQVFGLDPDRIWPTVFREDDEAFELWTQYVPANRITRFDEKENFWAMGDTGPCGPCSELLYDRGAAYGNATRPIEDPSGERFLEFWNLVFMQYNRNTDGTMKPLPKPSIDTGAGLERVVSLRMGVDSVFETDVLRSLITQVEEISGVIYDSSHPEHSAAFRVIADHMRCLAFAIADGVQPSNVDRGYVLRKVLRRAVRYGRQLGLEDPFLAKVLPRLVATMGDDYPELKASQHLIAEIITIEEEAFIRTLRRGGNILSQIIDRARGHKKIISGDDAFKLKDTYGFPLEEITLLAKDAGLTVDEGRYQVLEQEAKEKSRSAHKTTQQVASENLFAEHSAAKGSTEFLGYTHQHSQAVVKALMVNGAFVDEMNVGQEGVVVLDKTPFYPEMGGQIGDTGLLSGQQMQFTVSQTESPYKGVIAHVGKLDHGVLKVGQAVTASIDKARRQKIANNHTATHLLHWALHRVLGEHVKQAGSVVEPTRIRFDFSHHKALTTEEIYQIEDLINGKIRENSAVKNYEMPYEDAQKRQDIKQFFGEKYGSVVRVVDIDYSKELCGGTHTGAVGNIGLFRIAKESSIAAGIRRIEAVTGEEAELLGRQNELLINDLAASLKTQPAKLIERIEKLLEENKDLAGQLKTVKKAQLGDLAASLVNQAEMINGIRLIAAELTVAPDELRGVADEVMAKLQSGIAVLAAKQDDRCQLIVRVSDDLVAKGRKAMDILQVIAPIVEGSGGGKPNSAQAGGKAPHKIAEALTKARGLV